MSHAIFIAISLIAPSPSRTNVVSDWYLDQKLWVGGPSFTLQVARRFQRQERRFECVVSVFKRGGGQRSLVSSTNLGDGFTHVFLTRSSVAKRTFLVGEGIGSWNWTQVYTFNSRSLKPFHATIGADVLGVLQLGALDAGSFREIYLAKYADIGWDHGVNGSTEVTRAWHYSRLQGRFIAGSWSVLNQRHKKNH